MDKHSEVYMHAVDFDSALKREEILTHAVPWMNLNCIMLRGISPKGQYCMIPLIWGTQEWSRPQRQKREWWFLEPGGGGSGRRCLTGTEFHSAKVK